MNLQSRFVRRVIPLSPRQASVLRALSSAIVLAAVVACGGAASDVTSSGESVSAVVLTGAPTSTLLAGQTAQLIATPLNSTGAVISNGRVSWTSSDVKIAIVSPSGLVTAVDGGQATITAASGGATATVTIAVQVGATVSWEGAAITVLNSLVTLVVPPQSVGQATTLVFAPTPTAPANVRMMAGTAVTIGPSNLSFSMPATLKLKVDRNKLPAGVSLASLQLYTLSNGAWLPILGSAVDSTALMVRGTILRLGTFAVIGTPVAKVVLAGASVGGALFAGQSAQLTATTFDGSGNALPGRTIAWSSSDTRIATVDANGKVTALATGTVTISAASEGISQTTQLVVLARTTGDWSAATEWTTYQGNARHSGYVPVTVDASTFRELWVATPASTIALNPVTTGDGHVFASTQAYFGAQKLFALDLRSGSVVWTKDFGPIHGVHPPAYASGTVYVTTSGHQDSYLYAFDATNGTPRFRSSYGNQWSRYYAPVVIGNAVFMAGGGADGMYRFATDGTQNWFFLTNQYEEWSPAVENGVVYAYTGSYAPKLDAVDAATGKAIYSVPDPGFSWSGWSMNLAPAIGEANDLLVTNGGRLISFDLQARSIRWEQKSAYSGSVAVANGLLYVLNNNSQIEVRRESDGSAVGLWIPPSGNARGPVLVTKNLFFVSTTDATFAVDVGTRKQVWSYPVGGALALSSQGILLIAQDGGKLVAINVK
jgi:hypothetical protein